MQGKNNYTVSLVIFTCEGREHLLIKTISSFRKSCGYNFFQTILAIDGQINPGIVDEINADVLVQSPGRKGYVNNILQAIRQVDTDYFFWLEDDWEFPYSIPVKSLSDRLSREERLIQLVLSKSDRDSSGKIPAYISFSANPCLCNTRHIKNGFSEIVAAEKNEQSRFMGFENYLSGYMLRNGLRNDYMYQDNEAFVSHSGYLESTSRAFHMINTLKKNNNLSKTGYISGFGHQKKISIWNTFFLLPKLWIAVCILSFKIFYQRRAYDFAFRIYLSYKRKFNT
ncbi:hypothetical protein HDC92_002554 [Pedobacter sp. AK017]|uniref:glycosyltransferase n=1 Tax=Pedobacter sp. AK017 TaxID=2723073 RepID=UPI0016162573|nr:glycosyltransferase [Pedobacter sp. AK017]MBB5438873.1 hypothetical protein [Pedobacter sp. AK017]